MKRWTFRISLCLILGAVTTVGVAWGLVTNPDAEAGAFEHYDGDNYGYFLVPVDRSTGPTDPLFRLLGYQRVQLNPGCVSIAYYPGRRVQSVAGWMSKEEFTAILPAWSRFQSPSRAWPTCEPFERSHDSVSYHELAAGWPLKSMRCSYVRAVPGDDVRKGIHHIAVDALGAPLSIELGDDREVELPLRPVFPDFLINTLFYAAIWFGLFLAPGMTQRFIRARRGRCPRCGYDLRGELEDGCSECGWRRPEAEL